MLIAGAGGHAVELLSVLQENNSDEQFVFFDDVTMNQELFLGKYAVLSSLENVIKYFKTDPRFCVAVGNPYGRQKLAKKLRATGGKLTSVISSKAFIGKTLVEMGAGLNVMQNAVITGRCVIGEGVLVHINTSIHHDTYIGDYSELSPGSRILGGVKLGQCVSIGSNAVVLPGLRIGDFASVGAGAVVTKDVAAEATVVGVPAKRIQV